MGTKIYGIGLAENVDNAGETLKLQGFDDKDLSLIRDEHDEDSFFRKVGAITLHKKIFSQKDCSDAKQLRCWGVAQVPFLYAEAELADDSDHPNAKAAAELIKFASRPDIAKTLRIGWSVDGGVLERHNESGQPDEEGKILAKTKGLALALTAKPCNPKCLVFLENDLTKSDLTKAPPTAYWTALKKSQAAASFNEVATPDLRLFLKLDKLKKSLGDYFAAFTSIRCKKCGNGHRFFKSSSDLPNACGKCGSQHSMSDIWTALKK